MSTPYFITSPATPRNDAADRYSPEIAEAFHTGGTVRAATKKSEVVRATRTPSAPIEIVAAVTPTTAITASIASATSRSWRTWIGESAASLARTEEEGAHSGPTPTRRPVAASASG